MKKIILFSTTLLTLLILSGCSQPKATSEITVASSKSEKPELIIAAASDLTKAFTEVGASFEGLHHCTVTFSFGSTGTLAEQIANGAPFDIFAAANESVIQDLDEKGHIITDTIQLYALGRIGITTLKESPIIATTMEDLLDPAIKIIAIANPEHAPYGLAAKQALVSTGYWEALEPKLVYGKNISETLSFLTTKNADVAFIALSLNDASTLNFTLVDADLHEPLRQAIGVIKTSEQQELSKKFIEYISTGDGHTLMKQYGFTLPEE